VSANEIDVAVILTCHNRAALTLQALRHLFAQEDSGAALRIYLVDDGSTDGTSEIVARTYPDVRIIQGDGRLYWGGGMALAFARALEARHAWYRWVNDDTYLAPDALRRLLAAAEAAREQAGRPCIIVGATRDPELGTLTSSGVRNSRLRPLRFRQVAPTDRLQRCVTFQGNCVLIPASIAEDVGNIDVQFRHWIGDFDYGLRAGQHGHQSWIAAGYVGTCRTAAPSALHGSGLRALISAVNLLRHPKGVQFSDGPLYSFKEWARFAARHGGPLWPVFFAYPYRRLLKVLLFAPRSRA
jgi:GT2 family glycosyltransferase